MTTAQAIGAIVVVALAMVFITGGYAIHLKHVVDDIIRDEKAKLYAWALKRAERIAAEKFTEMLRTVRITIPVELINESDIDWGEKDDEAA